MPTHSRSLTDSPTATVVDVIHEDGETRLVRATWGEDEARVLCRTPRDDYPSPENIARLRYGYEVQAGLDLAGTARPIALERLAGSWTVVLEDFGATSVRNLLDEREIGVAEALLIAIGIASALGEIHTRQIVHKNINPASCLLYTSDAADE